MSFSDTVSTSSAICLLTSGRQTLNIALNVSQVPEIRKVYGANEIFVLLGCYATYIGS